MGRTNVNWEFFSLGLITTCRIVQGDQSITDFADSEEEWSGGNVLDDS